MNITSFSIFIIVLEFFDLHPNISDKIIIDENNWILYIFSCEIKNKKDGGGTHELTKLLDKISEDIDSGKYKDKIIIGIYDNDSSGYQEFNGLKESEYQIFKQGVVKKHKTKNIYAIIIPIPTGMEIYNQRKQEFKFFEIEHYFPVSFLEENNMLTELDINGIFEITGNKADFADKIKVLNEPEIFKIFENLFFVIDEINNESINYF
ncbi:hypothetical protein Lupro_02000 [Lutibacter profundi]|uniref:Uncharacterized protein n=1 Tax=Lutibacter profundi TaxID=1622118 RepID=A0A0X8G4U8_9FLAO|nr:hypothetical protein [Lutibacter profundi]AMC10094.1 hypothetical protein Lupro_02000 [Lutibacter profundi]